MLYQDHLYFFTLNKYPTKGLFGYRLFCWKLKTENWKHYNKIIFKYVNSPWDPFLMKVLLKKEIYGSREQYTRPTEQYIITWKMNLKKKKKNTKTPNAGILSHIQMGIKGYLILFSPTYSLHLLEFFIFIYFPSFKLHMFLLVK